MFSRLVRVWTAGHISNKTIYIKIQFSIYQRQKKMQAQKGRTKSALLIWSKSDLSDKVFNRYQYQIGAIFSALEVLRRCAI